MVMAAAGAHRPGPLKQQNKAHKGGKHSGSSQRRAGGEAGRAPRGFPAALGQPDRSLPSPRPRPRQGPAPPAAPRPEQGGPAASGAAAPPAAQGGGEAPGKPGVAGLVVAGERETGRFESLLGAVPGPIGFGSGGALMDRMCSG